MRLVELRAIYEGIVLRTHSAVVAELLSSQVLALLPLLLLAQLVELAISV